jgi:hypothetical protein
MDLLAIAKEIAGRVEAAVIVKSNETVDLTGLAVGRAG